MRRSRQLPVVPALTPRQRALWPLPDPKDVLPPKPISTFLLKIASRCNLDCDYCYVYRGADTSWREKPKIMSRAVIDRTIHQIARHVKTHDLHDIDVVLHGGEPLLAGLDQIEYTFRAARERIPATVGLGMQSNGTMLTLDVVRLFDSYNATIGLSLDGPQEANDRHRLDHGGRSSFAAVERALSLLRSTEAGRRVFSGILAVIDLANDPVAVYEYLSEFTPRTIDFLLPDATHERYPPGKHSFEDTAYGDWVIRLYEHWFAQPVPKTPIRLFENIISLLLGSKSDTEYLGLSPVDLIVIESDGAVEAVDTLKIAFDGAPALGMKVFANSFDEVIRHSHILSRMQGPRGLCDECQQCPLVSTCGGGYAPHRFSADRGFWNPSVYCEDLAKVIMHVYASLRHEIPGT